MKRFGNAVRLLAIVSVSLLVLVALIGCGDKKNGNGNTKSYSQDKPLGDAGKVKVKSDKQFNAEQQAVINKIAEFGDATEAKDYKKICNEIFSKQARKLGGDCAGVLRKTGDTIKNFSIEVTNVTIGADGTTATAEAVTTTNGQKGSQQSLTLAKDGKGEWRLTVLGQ